MKKKDIYLVFRFTGDNEIGIEEFSKFLDNTSKYLYSVKQDVGKDIKLKTKVVAIEKGSFIINILPEITLVTSLIVPLIEDTRQFIELVSKIFSLIDFLRGKMYKEITPTSITNYYGETTIINEVTYNIFKDMDNQTFKSVEKFIEDIPEKRELEIYDSVSNVKTVINDKNRGYFINNQRLEDDDTVIVNLSEKQTVIVRKPALDMSSKWTIHTDRSIQAEIEDEEFSNLVKNGDISFSNGMKLVVDIETTSYPNNEKVKPTYIIKKVHLNYKQQKLDI